MPAGDRTGPMGYGPMTGREAGFSASYEAPGFANPLFGRGRRFGRGRGFGFRGGWGRGFGRQFFGFGRPRAAPYPAYGYYPAPAPPSPQEEINALQEESEYLKAELDSINKRIAELQEKKE